MSERRCDALATGTSTSSVPNKPMVATATIWLASYSSNSLRRHIGQPLGRERRATDPRRSPSVS